MPVVLPDEHDGAAVDDGEAAEHLAGALRDLLGDLVGGERFAGEREAGDQADGADVDQALDEFALRRDLRAPCFGEG